MHCGYMLIFVSSRQAMPANPAWKRHGCYKLGSEQYFNMPLQRALTGCYDDWNSLDHFDPTTESRRMFAQFHFLRTIYPSLQDGLMLVQRGNWTHFVQYPGSNNTETEIGLWTVSRAAIPNAQTLTGANADVQVWLLYTNENSTQEYTFDCQSRDWISTPYVAGTVIKNLFDPYEEFTLSDSGDSFFVNGTAPWTGCLPSITMAPFGFKAFVPIGNWVATPPQLTKFRPGHDTRILSDPDNPDASSSVPISLEFNVPMDCTGVTRSVTLTVSDSGKGGSPTIGNVQCGTVANPDAPVTPGAGASAWYWNATISGVPDGILEIRLERPPSASGESTTGVSVYSISE